MQVSKLVFFWDRVLLQSELVLNLDTAQDSLGLTMIPLLQPFKHWDDKATGAKRLVYQNRL